MNQQPMGSESSRAAMELLDSARRALEAGQKRNGPMSISDWKELNRNTVRGIFSLRLPSGMQINGCMLHEREGQRWVGLPSIPREVGGKKVYSRVIEFSSKEVHERFQAAALAAVARQLSGVQQ